MGRGNIFEQSSFGHRDIPEASKDDGKIVHYLAINPEDIIPNADDTVLCENLKPGAEVFHVTQLPSNVTCPTCRDRWKL